MAFDPGAISANLAAAVGDDPALIAELHLAFLDSVEHALGQLEYAEDEEAWVNAARRLRGLAASFGAVRLMAVASEAVAAGTRDPRLLDRLKRMTARL